LTPHVHTPEDIASIPDHDTPFTDNTRNPENPQRMSEHLPTDTTAPRGLSINTLLILSFVVVSLLPISILGFKMYDAAWENVWREVREKHQSLAQNMATPIFNYINDRRIALARLRSELRKLPQGAGDPDRTAILAQGLDYLSGFRAVLLLNHELEVIDAASSYPLVYTNDELQQERGLGRRVALSSTRFLEKVIRNGLISVSPVVINQYTGKTTVMIAVPMPRHAQPGQPAVLMGEIKKDVIENYRAAIQFGVNGHSAVVDQLGQVIAHPNPAWMDDNIRDLSKLSIVQNMMAGKTGVTQFYSPFRKEDMVAGYTAVPKFGWGIMVPQPKAEVEAQVERMLQAELAWALTGIGLALAIAVALARWITRPINRLARAGRELQQNDYQSELPHLGHFEPLEIQQLGAAFRGAVSGLNMSRSKLDALNQSLQHRVVEATTELLDANAKLEQLAQSDHLTQLANRRHFEDIMAGLASRRQGDGSSVCLLLLDVDKFKTVNDQYGHSAGDAVLVQISEILRNSLRNTDLAARYAGDEFVVLLRSDFQTGRRRAAQLREHIDKHVFHHEDQSLHVTVSIGLLCCQIDNEFNDVKDILHRVDEAMYQAKRQGRNRVKEILINAKL